MKMRKPSDRLFVKSIIHLIFLIWQLCSYLKCETAELPYSEVSALSTVTDQFKSKVAAFSISSYYCDYTGSNYGFSITCDCTYGNRTICHIIGLLFSNLGLTGTIDEAVGDLLYLQRIVLSGNKLQGSIPSTLGDLEQLQTLDLSDNQLHGTIPESLGNLQNLEYLYLQDNFLDGMIPSSLGNLLSLKELNLDFNELWGPIPDELGNLTNLTRLRMAENKLSGTLPSTLGNLKFLEVFYLPSNDLKGKLPKSYANLTSMRSFVIAGNDLSGPLPDFVTNWTNVLFLTLHGNNFEGPIHAEYFNLSGLQYLVISDLNTSSPLQLPPSANIFNMYRLVLRNCSIDGSIPSYISELSRLKYLDLSFNKLTGAVPESWRSSLIYMSFASNNLTGSIPRWIFHATQTRMDLSYNNFSAIEVPVPKGLDINLFACCGSQNSSSPNIKPFMLKPDEMVEAYFPGKKHKFYSLFINCGGEQTTFHGDRYDADNDTARFFVNSMRNWAYSSSGDFLVETVNSSTDYTKRLPYRIPNSEASIYEEARLSPVSLHYYGLGLRNGRYKVTLYFAEIVYTEDIADYNLLRKRVFDVYIQDKRELTDFDIREQAEGPNAPINKTFEHVEVNDNSLLHIHFYWTGKGSYARPPAFNGPLISALSVTPEFKVGGLSVLQKALISVSSIVVALLLSLAFVWVKRKLENEELQKKIVVSKDQTVTLKELIKATGNFSIKNEIGSSGSLGTVYKAELKDRNIKVAVKRLSSKFKEKIAQLSTQIYHMKTMENGNLITLWDVHIGEVERLLVYEYVEGQSLDVALLKNRCGPNNREVDWDTRLSICRGIAEGLKHLHEPERSIVHGNIKPTNILLDGEGGVKLSDFGVVSYYDENELLHLAAKEASKGLHPPEYFQGDISTKSDVYSFGIILLVIVSGRKTEGFRTLTNETEYLLNKAHKLNKESKLKDLVDHRLKKYNQKQALDILNLALECTHAGSVNRPTMSEALSVLEGEPLREIIQRNPATSTLKGDTSAVNISGDVEETADLS